LNFKEYSDIHRSNRTTYCELESEAYNLQVEVAKLRGQLILSRATEAAITPAFLDLLEDYCKAVEDDKDKGARIVELKAALEGVVPRCAATTDKVTGPDGSYLCGKIGVHEYRDFDTHYFLCEEHQKAKPPANAFEVGDYRGINNGAMRAKAALFTDPKGNK